MPLSLPASCFIDVKILLEHSASCIPIPCFLHSTLHIYIGLRARKIFDEDILFEYSPTIYCRIDSGRNL